MKPKSINFVNYKSISQESDAFIFSDQFIPYFELEISGNFISEPLEAEKYTAGSTDNPEDYNLPEINNLVLPQKLSRINAFNKSSKESIYSIKDSEKISNSLSVDPSFMSEDALSFVNFLNNIEETITRKKTTENHVYISSSDKEFEVFTIGQRMYTLSNNNSVDEYSDTNIRDIENENNQPANILNEYKNNTTLNKNKYDYKTVIEDSRINEVNKHFSYDIYNSENSSVYDFSSKVETKTVINEVKNELITHMDQKITNLENKIINQNITKNEVNQIETKIIQVIENKLQKTEEQILEKIDERSNQKLNRFKNNFLNS